MAGNGKSRVRCPILLLLAAFGALALLSPLPAYAAVSVSSIPVTVVSCIGPIGTIVLSTGANEPAGTFSISYGPNTFGTPIFGGTWPGAQLTSFASGVLIHCLQVFLSGWRELAGTTGNPRSNLLYRGIWKTKGA